MLNESLYAHLKKQIHQSLYEIGPQNLQNRISSRCRYNPSGWNDDLFQFLFGLGCRLNLLLDTLIHRVCLQVIKFRLNLGSKELIFVDLFLRNSLLQIGYYVRVQVCLSKSYGGRFRYFLAFFYPKNNLNFSKSEHDRQTAFIHLH